MELNNKTAVITGASGGIGRAIARKLSASGCRVILLSRSTEKMENIQDNLAGESAVIETDVSDTESVRNAFREIESHFERIDILVNCAGVMPLTYLKNLHLNEWLETVEVNVKGVLRCIHQVLPQMTKRKAGHIVNITSVDGKELYRGGAVYGASKAALIALSKAMRMELSPDFNIRVTSIEPGTVDTDLRQDISDEELLGDKDYGGDEPMLQPEHIANAVHYAIIQPDGVNVNQLTIKPTGKS